MKITKVEGIPFAIPYRKPLRFASGEVTEATHVLVRVHTDEGLVGTAEAPPRPFTYGETQASILAIIRTVFGPQVVGLSPLEREQIRTRLDRTVGNPAAKSAIDMAVWDVIGQSVGLPVTELLGGYGNRMRVAHMVGFAEPVFQPEHLRRGQHRRTARHLVEPAAVPLHEGPGDPARAAPVGHRRRVTR